MDVVFPVGTASDHRLHAGFFVAVVVERAGRGAATFTDWLLWRDWFLRLNLEFPVIGKPRDAFASLYAYEPTLLASIEHARLSVWHPHRPTLVVIGKGSRRKRGGIHVLEILLYLCGFGGHCRCFG